MGRIQISSLTANGKISANFLLVKFSTVAIVYTLILAIL